ncbi:MAG: hypothetical protein KJN75_00410 [Muriicola sp.]|nr:hypothetical protein [Muriicola sp.]
MKYFFILIGTLLILAGLFLLIDPEILFGFLEENTDNTTIYIIAIVFRLLLGVLFVGYASQSKFPRIIKFIGGIAILAAILFVFIGQEGFQDVLAWVLHGFRSFGRIAGLVVIAFGGFIIHAFTGINDRSSSSK